MIAMEPGAGLALPLLLELGDAWREAANSLTTVDEALRRREPQEALRLAEAEELKARESGNRRLEAAALLALGRARAAAGSLEEAVKAAKDAGAVFEELRQKGLRSAALQLEGDLHVRRQTPAEAVAVASEALALCTELGRRGGEAAALATVASAHLARAGPSDGEAALAAASQAREAFTELGRAADAALASVTFIDAGLLGSPGPKRLAEAIQSLSEVVQELRGLGHRHGEAVALRSLAAARLAEGSRPRAALQDANAALELFADLADEVGKAAAMALVVSSHAACTEVGHEDSRELLRVLNEAVALYHEVGHKRQEAAALDYVAQIHLELGEPSEAAGAARKAMELSRELGDGEGELQRLSAVARAQVAHGQAEEASQAVADALAGYRAAGDRRREGLALRLAAELRSTAGDHEEALRLLGEAQGAVGSLGDLKVEASLLYAVVSVRLARGQREEALEEANRVLALVRERSDGSQSEAAALATVADVYLTAENPQKALLVAASAKLLFREVEDPKGEVGVLHTIIDAHRARGEREKAVDAALEIRHIFLKQGDWKGETEALLLTAGLHAEADDVLQAQKVASEAVQLCKEVGDSRTELIALKAVVDAGLAKVNGVGGNRALRAAQEMVVLARQVASKTELATVHHLLAQARLQRHMTTPAIEAAKEALKLYQEVENQRGEAMTFLTIADAHVLQEEGGAASRAASMAARLFERLEDKAMRAGSLNTLSNARVLKGDNRGAMKAADEARKLFEELGDIEAAAFVSDCIQRIQEFVASSHVGDGPGVAGDPGAGKGCLELHGWGGWQRVLEGHRNDLKILEVGAGTGGTTSSVLPQLNPWATQYVFTDLSNAFLRNAARRFAEFKFMEFALFDGEKHPADQGFCPHSFDVVLGTNVIHATSHLARTLGNVRSLLRPGGFFILNEISTSELSEDLTFGLTEGWWNATDVERRPTYPLLNVREWEELFLQCGYKIVYVRPNHGQNVFVAQECGMIEMPP